MEDEQEPENEDGQVKPTELGEITNDHLNHSCGVVYYAVLGIETGVMLDVADKTSPKMCRVDLFIFKECQANYRSLDALIRKKH